MDAQNNEQEEYNSDAEMEYENIDSEDDEGIDDNSSVDDDVILEKNNKKLKNNEDKNRDEDEYGEDDEEEDDDEDDEDDESVSLQNDDDDDDDVSVESDFEPRQVNDENYIKIYHPETLPINFDEMYNKTLIKRDSNGLIYDENHKTIPILSKYERTKVEGLRVKQLNKGAVPFIDGMDLVLDNNIIAKEELKQKKIPFIIRRPLPGGKYEFWNIKDLEILY